MKKTNYFVKIFLVTGFIALFIWELPQSFAGKKLNVDDNVSTNDHFENLDTIEESIDADENAIKMVEWIVGGDEEQEADASIINDKIAPEVPEVFEEEDEGVQSQMSASCSSSSISSMTCSSSSLSSEEDEIIQTLRKKIVEHSHQKFNQSLDNEIKRLVKKLYELGGMALINRLKAGAFRFWMLLSYRNGVEEDGFRSAQNFYRNWIGRIIAEIQQEERTASRIRFQARELEKKKKELERQERKRKDEERALARLKRIAQAEEQRKKAEAEEQRRKVEAEEHRRKAEAEEHRRKTKAEQHRRKFEAEEQLKKAQSKNKFSVLDDEDHSEEVPKEKEPSKQGKKIKKVKRDHGVQESSTQNPLPLPVAQPQPLAYQMGLPTILVIMILFMTIHFGSSSSS